MDNSHTGTLPLLFLWMKDGCCHSEPGLVNVSRRRWMSKIIVSSQTQILLQLNINAFLFNISLKRVCCWQTVHFIYNMQMYVFTALVDFRQSTNTCRNRNPTKGLWMPTWQTLVNSICFCILPNSRNWLCAQKLRIKTWAFILPGQKWVTMAKKFTNCSGALGRDQSTRSPCVNLFTKWSIH